MHICDSTLTKQKGKRVENEDRNLNSGVLELGTLNLTRMAYCKANTTVLLISLLHVIETFYKERDKNMTQIQLAQCHVQSEFCKQDSKVSPPLFFLTCPAMPCFLKENAFFFNF